MQPYLFKIGEFPIRSFGLMVLLGVLAASWWLSRTLPKLGVTEDDPVGDLAVRAILTGFVGARLMYLAIHPDAWTDILSPIALWRGGLVSYGGFIGGALGAYWFARRRKIPMPRLGDAAAPALALGQTFGRIGCLLVGDDHGKQWKPPVDQPDMADPWWTLHFPSGMEGSLIPRDLLDQPLYPSQPILSLMNLALFLIGAWLFARRKFDGQVLSVTIVLYAVGRFLVERTRGDDEARGIYGMFSTAQWISIGMVVFGTFLYIRWRGRAAAQPATA